MDRLLPCPYFCIFCWTVCANGPAKRLGLVPGAAGRAASSRPLHLPVRGRLSRSLFIPALRPPLPPGGQPSCPTAGSTGVDAATGLDLCLDQELPSLPRLPSAQRRLQGQRLGPHSPPFFVRVVAYRIYFCAGSLFSQGSGDNGHVPLWRRDQGRGAGARGARGRKTALTSLALL